MATRSRFDHEPVSHSVAHHLVAIAGPLVARQDYVSHCYQRPRHLPDWPYNLFAMVHGPDRAAVRAQVSVIAGLLGAADRGHDVLFSTRILKKTGLRLSGAGTAPSTPGSIGEPLTS